MEILKLRQKFLAYFAIRDYKVLPEAALIPANDQSVLFTTAGMQQFKFNYTNPQTAPFKNIVTIQPCVRTSDIAEVGDDTHLTTFEMLGNFVFDQTNIKMLKEKTIQDTWQFIHNELGVDASRVYATVFAGDKRTMADKDSASIWRQLGIKVKPMPREDNFWGPTGDEGPCGPNTEIYIDGVEVWNLVFNQYYQDVSGDLTLLDFVGLDTGSGLERLSATLQGKKSVWQINPFTDWLSLIGDDEASSRVIIDHLKAVVFIVSAGVVPGNKGRDYILRRLIRKLVFIVSQYNRPIDLVRLTGAIRGFYSVNYSLVPTEEILTVLMKEKEQFERNLTSAQKYLNHWLAQHSERDVRPITELAFYMYESFGFPKELVLEHLQSLGWQVDHSLFEKLFVRHQEVSRAGSDKQFKGGLADHQPQTIKNHTAHHLLLAALQQVLGKDVVQKGSNVTSERLRLDFNFSRKLTSEELKKVETIVNEKIQADLPVIKEEMTKDKALDSGAQAEFGQKYGDKVTVYTIKNLDGSVFSHELCGGPHAERTGLLGHFTITKEEASSQGVRRIKAKLE